MVYLQTKNKYEYFEVMSALQKEIRRGNEEDALWWAFELIDSNMWGHLKNRLKVISQEDIGIGNIDVVNFVHNTLQLADDFWKAKKTSYRLCVANVIMALCRAEKSRDGDNLQGWIRYIRETKPLKQIPDYALDGHTLRGKKKGRGVDFFFEVGSKLSNDVSTQAYKDVAPEAFIYHSKNKNKPEPKKENGGLDKFTVKNG